MLDPFGALRRARQLTDTISVGISGGKDSLVLLDLCAKWFKKVVGFHLYILPSLSFREKQLAYLSRRYGVEIHRLPDPLLSRYLQANVYAPSTGARKKCPRIKQSDIELAVRETTGLDWIAYGEKYSDSIARNAKLKKCQGLDEKFRRVYPLAFWSNKEVYAYLNLHRIPLPPDYRLSGHSMGGLSEKTLLAIHDHYPEDFERIERMFPNVGAVVARRRFRSEQVPEVCPGNGSPQPVQERAV